jgi:hypothetical protein
MTRALVAVALLSSGFVTAAAAQDRGGVPAADRAAMRSACLDDFRKLCPGVRPGGGRIRECMLARESQLSSTCRTALHQSGKAVTR